MLFGSRFGRVFGRVFGAFWSNLDGFWDFKRRQNFTRKRSDPGYPQNSPEFFEKRTDAPPPESFLRMKMWSHTPLPLQAVSGGSKTAGAMIRHRACIVSWSLVFQVKIRHATATGTTWNASKQVAIGISIWYKLLLAFRNFLHMGLLACSWVFLEGCVFSGW